MSAVDGHALLDAMAAAVDLPVPRESRDAVAANLVRLHALAAELLEHGLAPDAAPPVVPKDAGRP